MDIPEDKYTVSKGSDVGSIRTMTHIGEPLKEVITKKDDAAFIFEYEICDDTSKLVNMTRYQAGFQITPNGSGSSVRYYCDAEAIDAGEGMPSEGQPPWATKDGLEALFMGAYPAWVAAADKVAAY